MIWQVFKWEYLRRLKSKLFLFTAVIIPLFVMGAMILPSMLMSGESTEKTNIGLYDATNGLGMSFVDQLQTDYKLKNGEPEFNVDISDSQDELKTRLTNKDISAYIVFPDSMLENNQAGLYVRSASNFKTGDALKRTLNKIVMNQRLEKYHLDPQVIQNVTKRVYLNTYQISKEGETNKTNELVDFFFPFISMMILYMTILFSAQILLRSVIEERSSRMVEILLSTLTPDDLMKGKIFGLGALGITQLFFYLFVGSVVATYQGMNVFNANFMITMVVFFLLGFMFYAAIFAALGSVFDSEQEAQQISGMISLIMVVPIALSTYFITNPTALATKILTFIPPITPFLIILRAGTSTLEIWEQVTAAVIMLLSVWVIIKLAGKVFRTSILLYGKRITFSEIIRWIRS